MPALTASPHFTADEFACHDGTPYPAAWIDSRLRPLCAVLEAIREACEGRPIRIVSGYRSPAYNAARARASVGVAKDSQHIHGRAADIAVDGMAPSDVWRVLMQLSASGKVPQLGGAGVYRGWVHVDVRERAEDGHMARWLGDGLTAFPA